MNQVFGVLLEKVPRSNGVPKIVSELITYLTEKEARIESMVVAKGYRQCVVFINDEGANVIVEKTNEGLQNTDLARIKEIVLNETNLTAEQVKVIETA